MQNDLKLLLEIWNDESTTSEYQRKCFSLLFVIYFKNFNETK